ncbi:MAG: hypothetical protein GTN70_03010 [Deltaproteobacteria bacterium]|nr:hypothetical protein [Deltaproteobacteria bacterium]NIS76617.1 hypothetical protein [Deltaproteobacteria bacterium]
MSRLQKILLLGLITLTGIILILFILLFLQRETLFARLVYSANRYLHSSGYSLSYEEARIELLPPRLYLEGVLVTDLESGNPVFAANKSYLSVKPLNLIIPGASPLSLKLEQFRGVAERKILDLIAGSPERRGEKKRKRATIPTLTLTDGYFEFIGPWKNINQAKLSVKSLYYSGNIWEGLGVIYTSGKEGIAATINRGGKDYPVKISSLHVNSHILTDKVDIKKLRLESPYGNLSVRGRYDMNRDELEGHITGDIDPEKIVQDYQLGNFDNIVRSGRVSFSGRALLSKGRISFSVDTEFFDLSVRGIECTAFARCIYDNGRFSVSKLSLRAPFGKLTGDVQFDITSFQGKGEFEIIDFYPGNLTDILFKDSLIGAEGKGKGRIVLSAPEKGTVILQSALQMEGGFSLVLREMEERITWAEPVALNNLSVITDIFQNPSIDVRELTIADEENVISLKGSLDMKERIAGIKGDIDITRVKSLGLRGIFARSGAIRGDFSISGNLSNPLIESSFSLREFSFRELPPGNIFLKASGVLGGSISVIADYTSTIGSMLFAGTYFPDKELYFTGSLKAENVDVGAFTSDNFLEKEIHDSLVKRFSIVFPVAGNVSFDGNLLLGKDTVNARGELSSDQLRSSRMNLQEVRGNVGYDDGLLTIRDISFKAFGGGFRARGSVGKDQVELLGNFSDIDPVTLNRLISDETELVKGETLDGAFIFKYSGDEVELLDFHLSSERISIQDADLTGLILDGTKKGHVLSFSLSTSNKLVNLDLDYDLEVQNIVCNIAFDNFPIKFSDKPYDERLGFFGINISGSAAVGVKSIFDISESPWDIFFKAKSLKMDFKATPVFSRYERDLPEYHVEGQKRDGGVVWEIRSAKSGQPLIARVEKRKDGLFLSIGGQVSSGLFPLVLPSSILAEVESDLLIEFEGPLVSFPKGGTGRAVLSNLNLAFPGENVTGEKIVVRFEEEKFIFDGASLSANNNVFSLSGRVGLNGFADLLLTGEYDAGLVHTIVSGVFEKINGKVAGGIQIRGTFPDVEVSGQGLGKDLFIKFVGFKHPLEDVTAGLTFFKDRILFDSISATLGGGELEGSGEVNIRKDVPVNLSFNADFYGVNLAYPSELPSRLDGAIELLGPVTGLFLRGEIYVDRAVYTEPIYPEEILVDVKKNIEKFNAPVGKAFAINLDIECISDGTIFIKNNIAEAIAGGSFRLLGDTTRPVIIGTFEAIEGEVEFRGTEYTIERLIVDFDNPLSNNPNIDAFSRAEKGEYTIFVEVTGRLDDYLVELYSEPPLSKNDIVSLLSLGVTTEEYAENGSSVTTAGLATVALSPLKTQIEEGIRTFTGFERFSVESNYSPITGVVEPTVVIGKTLGDSFSIDFSTSLVGSGRTNVIGEFRLIKDLYFRGDWTGGGTASEGDVGGELRVKKRFHGLTELGEKLFGGERW